MSKDQPEPYLVSLYQRGLTARAATVTLNDEEDGADKSVRVVASTENPVRIYDWERGIIDEVLVMDGFSARREKSVPFLDSHSRNSLDDVIGAFQNFEVNEANELVGDVVFDDGERGNSVYNKYKRGMVTDVSVGYQVLEAAYLEDGESKEIGGRKYEGPLKLALRWQLHELSGVPIGADPDAFALQTKAFPKLFSNSISEGEPPMSKDPARQESPVEPKVQEVDVEAIRAQAVKDEAERQSSIRSLCKSVEVDIADDLCADPAISVDVARGKILEAVAARRSTDAAPSVKTPVVTPGADAQDKFRAVAGAALNIRAGVKIDEKDDCREARNISSLSLMDLGRELLAAKGENVRFMSRHELAERALSTSDLPILLGETMNKVLIPSYEQAPETWKVFCGTGRTNDFKTNTIAQLGESDDLEEVLENGEYKLGNLAERKEQYALKTYGREYVFGRHMLINDDLGSLVDFAMELGNASARHIGDTVYEGVLVGNPAMGDGTELFHADHNNLIASGTAPSITSIGAAVTKMALQTDIKEKKRLNLRPRYFISSVANQTLCEQLFRSGVEGTQAKPNLVNPYNGSYFTRVYDARLDGGNNPWFLAGESNRTIRVYFLNGTNDAPIIERKQDMKTDGVKWRVTLDYAVKATDWKSLVKNPGA